MPTVRRLLLAVGCGLGAALLCAAQAPAPATITVTPHYAPNATYTYDLQIDSHIVRAGAGATSSQPAELTNTSRVGMHVLPQSPVGGAIIELRFLQYHTSVRAGVSLQQQLQEQMAESDDAATHMAPVRIRLQPDGSTKVIERPQGAVFDQPVSVLEQFARTDMLPVGPVAIGTHWQRTRVQDLPTMHFSLPLQMQCTLAGSQKEHGQAVASIAVQMQGSATLPPDGIPNVQELAAAGYAASGSIAITGTSNNQYREADGLLLSSSSQNHNVLKIELVGPTATPQDVTTTIDSTGTVKLVNEKR